MKLQSNQQIGYLTLVKSFLQQDKNKQRRYWKCRCVCQKEVTRREDYLQRVVFMKNRTPSCGCKHSIKTSLGSSAKSWKGYGNIGGEFFSGYRCKARKKKWDFTITKKYIWELYLAQKKRCALTGRSIFIKPSKRTPGEEMTASLDRIDSGKGYIPGNVQWVHKDINRMKNHYNQDYFIETCREVAAYQKKETIAHQDNILQKINQHPKFAT